MTPDNCERIGYGHTSGLVIGLVVGPVIRSVIGRVIDSVMTQRYLT